MIRIIPHNNCENVYLEIEMARKSNQSRALNPYHDDKGPEEVGTGGGRGVRVNVALFSFPIKVPIHNQMIRGR